MAFGPDVKTRGFYEATFQHTPTGMQLVGSVSSWGTADDATQDAVFQAFVTRMLGMPNVTLVSAVRKSYYTSQVTSP